MSKNEPKQVIIIRADLRNLVGQKLRTGKLIAQGAHASLKAIFDNAHKLPAESETIIYSDPGTALGLWLEGRSTKICVSCNSEQELIDLYDKAKAARLICSMVIDAGLTEFGGVPTKTAVAIGPAYPEDVDPITSHLSLL